MGDEDNYLRVRQANLNTETQYIKLAEYWQKKENPLNYLATLEKWVSNLPQKRNEQIPGLGYYLYSYSSNYSAILQKLAEHYCQHQEMGNLCRILITTAEHRGVTLELYKEIQKVSQPLEKWQKLKTQLIK